GVIAGARGEDRYDTVRIVAAAFDPAKKVGVATGTTFPDALTGGAYMASVGGPLLLTEPGYEPAATVAAIARVASTAPDVEIFGGPRAVSTSVSDGVIAAVQGNGVIWTF